MIDPSALLGGLIHAAGLCPSPAGLPFRPGVRGDGRTLASHRFPGPQAEGHQPLRLPARWSPPCAPPAASTPIPWGGSSPACTATSRARSPLAARALRRLDGGAGREQPCCAPHRPASQRGAGSASGPPWATCTPATGRCWPPPGPGTTWWWPRCSSTRCSSGRPRTWPPTPGTGPPTWPCWPPKASTWPSCPRTTRCGRSRPTSAWPWADWPSGWRGWSGPATSTGWPRWWPSCSTWSGRPGPTSARRTPSSSPWSAGWSPTSPSRTRSSLPDGAGAGRAAVSSRKA